MVQRGIEGICALGLKSSFFSFSFAFSVSVRERPLKFVRERPLRRHFELHFMLCAYAVEREGRERERVCTDSFFFRFLRFLCDSTVIRQ